MKNINSQKAYLIMSMVAFALSCLGFAGLLSHGEMSVKQSVYFGFMFLFAGIFLLSCVFRKRK